VGGLLSQHSALLVSFVRNCVKIPAESSIVKLAFVLWGPSKGRGE
jgi:hypothetical protein